MGLPQGLSIGHNPSLDVALEGGRSCRLQIPLQVFSLLAIGVYFGYGGDIGTLTLTTARKGTAADYRDRGYKKMAGAHKGFIVAAMWLKPATLNPRFHGNLYGKRKEEWEQRILVLEVA